MWSPSKRKEAEYRYDAFQRLDMEKMLGKSDERELTATTPIEDSDSMDQSVRRKLKGVLRAQR